MKVKLAITLSAAGLLFAIAATHATALTLSRWKQTLESEVQTVGCVGGKRCTSYYTNKHGARVCRAWVACNSGCVSGRRCTSYYTNKHGARICRTWVACD